MNSPLPLNEIYRQYLELYFHNTPLSEPPRTRSEIERALKLSADLSVGAESADHGLDCFAPKWLRGEPETEPFPENAEANRRWREAQRTQRQEREAALRQRVTRGTTSSRSENE